MKIPLLIVGGLSVISGLVMFTITIGTQSYVPGVDPNAYRYIAAAWLFAGIVGAVIPFGLAEVLGRLEGLENSR